MAKHQLREALAKAAGLVAIAAGAEAAIRSLSPIPYAPRWSDVALSIALYSLCAIPSLIAAVPGKWPARLGTVVSGAPVGLLAGNLALAFGARPVAGLLFPVVGGCGAGIVLNVVSWKGLLITAAAFGLCAGAVRATRTPRMASETAPSVLLVVLDTVGAGHLSTYGYVKATTPNLDALASRGVLYNRAIATAPWTVPSHGSIFTGLYPSEMGFDGWDFRAPRDVGTLAGDLDEAGRQPYAISANPFIPNYAGLSRGFRKAWGARELSQPLPTAVVERLLNRGGLSRRAPLVSALALDWLDRISVRGEPWFLFLNYIDPHAPYRPPAWALERFAPGVDPAAVAPDTEVYNSGQVALTPDVRRAMADLYDGEIAATDAGLGQLLLGLGDRGYDESNLLIVVTSDHGESFGDHGIVGHLLGMPESVLHVPLIVSGLGITQRKIEQPVQPVQLRATVRRILGLPDVAGIALALPPWGAAPSMIVSEHPSPRWYVNGLGRFNELARLPVDWSSNWVALERDGHKAVFDDRSHVFVYDIAHDPQETTPLDSNMGDELIREYHERFNHVDIASPALQDLSAADRERLRELGYLRQ